MICVIKEVLIRIMGWNGDREYVTWKDDLSVGHTWCAQRTAFRNMGRFYQPSYANTVPPWLWQCGPAGFSFLILGNQSISGFISTGRYSPSILLHLFPRKSLMFLKSNDWTISSSWNYYNIKVPPQFWWWPSKDYMSLIAAVQTWAKKCSI